MCPLFLENVKSDQSEEIAHELVNLFYIRHRHTECIMEEAILYGSRKCTHPFPTLAHSVTHALSF